MYKSKINSLHKVSKLVPICLLLSIYSLFSCNFATAINTSYLSRKNSPALVKVLAHHTPEESNINPLNVESIKKVAKTQNAALVQYSILYEADSVVGSLWDVDHRVTTFLITEFYDSLSRNGHKAGALRQVMLETMKKYPNPQDWAGFTLIGLL